MIVGGRLQRLADALDECLLATRCAALVREHPTGNAKQPRPRLIRDVGEPTPRDLKGPGERVDGRLGIGPRP